jgi:hypothetical protein
VISIPFFPESASNSATTFPVVGQRHELVSLEALSLFSTPDKELVLTFFSSPTLFVVFGRRGLAWLPRFDEAFGGAFGGRAADLVEELPGDWEAGGGARRASGGVRVSS